MSDRDGVPGIQHQDAAAKETVRAFYNGKKVPKELRLALPGTGTVFQV
jgi:hypothetical protein